MSGSEWDGTAGRSADPGQLRFFLLDQQGGRATLLHHISVHGPVDPDRLLAAARAVCEAQPALRTSLHLTPEGLVQYAHPASDVDITAERAARGSDLADRIAETRAPFEHGAGPLCRIRIVTTPDTTHCLVGVHHAVFDEDSTGVLMRQLARAYEEGPQALPHATHRPRLPSPERAAILDAFWSGRLDGCPQDVALPRIASTGPGGHGIVSVPLTSESAATLRRRARESGATPFAQVLAAVAAVIGWYGGTEDIVLATVAANRTPQDSEVIGCLQNTLPVRLELAGADTTSVLDRAVDALFDAVDHADLPIEDILRLVGAARSPGRKPLTQIICTQSTAPAALDVGPLRWQLLPPVPTEAEYELAVTLHQDPSGALALTVEHQLDALAGPAARLFAEHLIRALSAFGATPAVPLTELALSDPDVPPRRAVTRSPWATVADRVGEHALRRPAAVALVTDREQLDYAELDRRVRGLAAVLMEAGVRPGDRVGVCLPRTASLVVALLAVWRVGGAYVPLDPQYPVGRLRLMIEDTRPAAVIGDAVPGLVPQGVEIPVLAPDAVAATMPGQWPVVRPQDQAYVIHTSGTTGRPKGVVVRHENLSALFAAFEEQLPSTPRVTVAGTSISFDISGLEMHWPLAAGRTVLLTSHREVADARVPHGALYQCTPTMARILADDPAGRRLLGGLGALLVGGEPLPRDLADRLTDLVPGPVLNCYGPTETTIWSTVWRVVPGVPVHIGHPLTGQECRVVDVHGRRMPPGVPGRLLILGEGVSSGYWEQPELTSAKFREHEGRLCYETGDLAVLDPEHGVRFLGRADTQVKVLGQRIELAEIESVLRAHPTVRDAVATVTADGTAITACLVPTEPGSSKQAVPAPAAFVDEMRRHAATSLVAAMIPARWLLAAELPQLPNGKLDRATVADWAAEAAPVSLPPAVPAAGEPRPPPNWSGTPGNTSSALP